MATKEGSGPKASRSGSSRPPNASADSAIEIDGVDEQERRYPSNQKVSIPAGSPPKMPSDDKLLNWPMVEMRFRIWLRRLPMLNEILSEEIGRNEDEIAAQKIKFGTQNIDMVYSFICEMCLDNETAMTQVQTHWQIDPHLWPNSLWKLLCTRFQFSNKHRVQEFVAALINIAIKPDRFNKALSEIRSIDPTQVQKNNFISIEILKNSIKHERALMII